MSLVEFVEHLPEDGAPAPTREQITERLRANPLRWAIVARPDRAARAAVLAGKIDAGQVYGGDVRATVRQVGAEHRVYASYVPLSDRLPPGVQ